MFEFNNIDSLLTIGGVILLFVYSLVVGYSAITGLNRRVDMQGLLALLAWLAGAMLVLTAFGVVESESVTVGAVRYVPIPAMLILPAFMLALIHLLTAQRLRRSGRGE